MNALVRLLMLLLMTFMGMSCAAEPSPTPKGDPAFEWIDRPWEYRYLFQIVTTRTHNHLAESCAKDIQNREAYRNVYGYFNPTVTLVVPADSHDSDDSFAITRIDVMKDRTVTTPNTADVKLTARLMRLGKGYVVLSPSAEHPAFVVDFGQFFMGTYAASDLRYSPTICSKRFGDSVRPDEPGRYSVGSEPGSDGYFGCREWAAQLYAKNRPYIDVTSYEIEEDFMQDKIKTGKRKGKYPLIPVTYVRPFIGFARYDDPLKPVIGNHKGTWACFNDCPDGEAPGIIPDIKAWAAKHNWPVPKKPKNVREFMDKKPDATDLIE